MRPISPKVKQALLQEPDICARRADGSCGGCITWEHTLIHAGKQIDEVWAIIKLCEYHHSVGIYQDKGDLWKERNVWIALNRANDKELRKYSKAIDYIKQRKILNSKHGIYENNK